MNLDDVRSKLAEGEPTDRQLAVWYAKLIADGHAYDRSAVHQARAALAAERLRRGAGEAEHVLTAIEAGRQAVADHPSARVRGESLAALMQVLAANADMDGAKEAGDLLWKDMEAASALRREQLRDAREAYGEAQTLLLAIDAAGDKAPEVAKRATEAAVRCLESFLRAGDWKGAVRSWQVLRPVLRR